MLENLAKERKIQNVKFTGYVPYEQMAAYLVKSDVLINSFVRKAPQSIVTKIGDYLAAGKPMINTCMSPEFRKKVEQDGFGINIEPEDVRELVNAVEWMCTKMRQKERRHGKPGKEDCRRTVRPTGILWENKAMISSLITKRK
ncbi:MAG: glycosyltransferase [Mediterraneibacter gnavus]